MENIKKENVTNCKQNVYKWAYIFEEVKLSALCCMSDKII